MRKVKFTASIRPGEGGNESDCDDDGDNKSDCETVRMNIRATVTVSATVAQANWVIEKAPIVM